MSNSRVQISGEALIRSFTPSSWGHPHRVTTFLKEARSTKTWKPSEQVEYCSRQNETKSKHCSLDELENEEEVTNDTEPSERPSVDEEYAIMEAAEEVNSSNVEEEISVVSSFCSFLQSTDGGRKDKKLSKQHGSQLLHILQTIDPSQQFQSLFNKTLLRDTFLKQAEKRYTADTMKAYLLSLRNFCTYMYVIAENLQVWMLIPYLFAKFKRKHDFGPCHIERIVNRGI